jgi:hypothetical protein
MKSKTLKLLSLDLQTLVVLDKVNYCSFSINCDVISIYLKAAYIDIKDYLSTSPLLNSTSY